MGSNIENKVSFIKEYAKQDKSTLRRLIMSVISLVIASAVLATTTFSWFSIKSSELQANNFSLDCSKGLRVNDTGTSELNFSEDDQYIIPASSVNGRNLFFPADGTDFSSTTSSMTFRSANVGDKNINYIQIDFTLTAQQNHTALYINDEEYEENGETKNKTSIKVRNTSNNSQEVYSTAQAGALRSALWCSTAEDGVPNTPIVFNPTSSTVRTGAVAEIDRSTGAFASEGRQVAHAFSEYAFGGTPVATLQKGVETKFSYIVWLEGTDSKCTDKIKSKDIQINLAFTTSWDKTKTIRFKDETTSPSSGWVSELMNNQHYSLTLHYEDSQDNTITDFNMYPYSNSTDEWSCNIPGDMTNRISFILRPPSSAPNSPTYEFTRKMDGGVNEDTYDRGTSRQYIARAQSRDGTSNNLCRGYWKAIGDSDGGGHDSGGDFDGDDF